MSNIFGASNSAYELLYGGVQDSFINNVQARVSSLAQSGIGLASSFIDSAKEMFNRVGSHDVIRSARRAIAGIATFATGDQIMVLTELLDFQLAKSTNRRWLLTDPFVREQYHNLEIAGWGDKYVDAQPGVIGRDHYDFRIATTGLVFLDEEEERWYRDQFYHHLKKDEQPLIPQQQFDIQRSISNLRGHIQAGEEDPTDVFGGML